MTDNEHYDSLFYFGRHPVLEAIASGRSVEKVLLQQGTHGPFEKELRLLCKTHDVPLQNVPKEKLAALVRGNHQGVVAIGAPIDYQRLEHVLPLVFERGELPLLIILDGVTDVRNVGAIARSAEACGAQALVLGQKRTAPINAEAIKASAGALSRLPVCRERSLVNTIDWLRDSGVQVLAADVRGGAPLHAQTLTLPTAIVMGSEDKGPHPALLERCGGSFFIPQVGPTESLNVSVAAGMVLYEAMRQRLLEGH